MLRNKPNIGVITSSKDGYFMWLCTRLGVGMCGGKVMRITPDNNADYSKCDGFIIAGGTDIDPALYGGNSDEKTVVDKERDSLDTQVVKHAIETKKPVLGISRGAHIINIVHGGTLHQETHHFYEDIVPSKTIIGQAFRRRRVEFKEDSILTHMYKRKRKIRVNTIHHQVNDKIGEGLKPVAEDREGVVQAVELENSKEHFVLGVEWHPEFMLHSRAHRKLFVALVGMAKVYARTS